MERERLRPKEPVWECAWLVITLSGMPMCPELRKGGKGDEATGPRVLEPEKDFSFSLGKMVAMEGVIQE